MGDEHPHMTFEIVFVLGLTLAALVLFAMDRLRLDQVAMSVPVVLLLSGILTPAEAVSGLSSRATVTVGSMLVLGLGLRKTGLVSAIGAWARTAPLGGKYSRMFALCLVCALLSPFLMTTAVVMVFLPVFVALADQAEEPASRYLMPLSFVSILGGTVTLMGTSTNLVVHGEAMRRGFDELHMFSITPLGLICLAVGLLYLFTAGRVLLPRRVRAPDLSSKYDIRRFVTELHVPEDSPANGRSLAELKWGERYGVTVLDIERGEQEITAPHGDRHIRPGDVLYVQGSAERLLELARRQRLETPRERKEQGLDLAGGSGRLVEVLVAPGSSLVSRTLRDLNFAQRYDAAVLAIQHHGVTVTERLAEVSFRVGDLLLVHGTANALGRLVEDPGFVPVGEVKAQTGRRPRAGVAAAIMVGVVLSASLGVLDIMTAALSGVGLMVFTRCVRVEEIYAEMEWMVLFVLAGLIPLGVALETTGAAELLARGVVAATAPLGASGLVAAFYLVTVLMTAIVSNAATAVMLTPVAILAATQAGVNPYALLIAVMFGASASFVTPFGYQTNVMIYGPGGYRFSDFVKVGGLLNLVLLITASLLIPVFWPS
ncbi:MAG: SLC13 family permease [Gemmatimonadales bacterium]|nr:SLC13 family permease [Candidatus Palauibacter irciniicola]MYC17720.1 SLC13 family permease [Gemmatimonadales bacterium]